MKLQYAMRGLNFPIIFNPSASAIVYSYAAASYCEHNADLIIESENLILIYCHWLICTFKVQV